MRKVAALQIAMELESEGMEKEAFAPALLGAGLGTVLGAGTGALAGGEGNRLGGALAGGLGGAALGAGGGLGAGKLLQRAAAPAPAAAGGGIGKYLLGGLGLGGAGIGAGALIKRHLARAGTEAAEGGLASRLRNAVAGRAGGTLDDIVPQAVGDAAAAAKPVGAIDMSKFPSARGVLEHVDAGTLATRTMPIAEGAAPSAIGRVDIDPLNALAGRSRGSFPSVAAMDRRALRQLENREAATAPVVQRRIMSV